MVRSALACSMLMASGLAPASASQPNPFRMSGAATDRQRHAVRGVVRVLTGESLTIARTSRHHEVLVFRLNTATVHSGPIAPGIVVSVRYRYEGSERVATAVSARPAPGLR
jgi:hypothetical protein